MFKLKDKWITPPRGFTWVDPVTLMEINARNHANWLSQAIDHRVANGLPIVSEEEMEDQLCLRYDGRTRSQVCVEYDGNGLVQRLGVGGTLKAMLAGFGINACWGCIDLAKRMDDWGPDGCEEHMDEILATMNQNAEQKKWIRYVPFREAGSEALVRLAIGKVRNQACVST